MREPRHKMPGAAVSAACGLPSPRTDLETDVGASPHAKTSGTKRPAAVVTPSPDPKRPKGSHRPPQQETEPPLVAFFFQAGWRLRKEMHSRESKTKRKINSKVNSARQKCSSLATILWNRASAKERTETENKREQIKSHQQPASRLEIDRK